MIKESKFNKVLKLMREKIYVNDFIKIKNKCVICLDLSLSQN